MNFPLIYVGSHMPLLFAKQEALGRGGIGKIKIILLNFFIFVFHSTRTSGNEVKQSLLAAARAFIDFLSNVERKAKHPRSRDRKRHYASRLDVE